MNTRLIEDLREIMSNKRNSSLVRSCAQQSIETIEHLHVIEAAADKIVSASLDLKGSVTFDPSSDSFKFPRLADAVAKYVSLRDRSTGAADAGEDHG